MSENQPVIRITVSEPNGVALSFRYQMHTITGMISDKLNSEQGEQLSDFNGDPMWFWKNLAFAVYRGPCSIV